MLKIFFVLSRGVNQHLLSVLFCSTKIRFQEKYFLLDLMELTMSENFLLVFVY